MEGLARFDNLIRCNQISVELEKIPRNPILAGESQGEGLEHYRCQLVRPGKRLDVFLSVRPESSPLTLFDVLFMLALDASGCDTMAGLEKYRDISNSIFGGFTNKLKEMELFWEEFESRCRQSEQLREFLGSSAYEELLSLFGLEEDHERS
jgi:hypothetical protein